MRYSTSAHTRFYHRFHVVWVTKYRYKVLQGPMRERIREIIRQTCEEMGVHPLIRLADRIDWEALDGKVAGCFGAVGRPAVPHERSGLSHWCNRLGAEVLEAVKFPTDAALLYNALTKLGIEARAAGIKLRQSYIRVGKRAQIMAGRYAHAKQYKRIRKQLKFLKTRLGRVIRDIERNIDGDPELQAAFSESLRKARITGAQAPEPQGQTEGLFLARARGRVHRQGQGHDHHHQRPRQGRDVHPPCRCRRVTR